MSYPADLVAILAEDGADHAFTVNWAEYFPGVGDTDARLNAVLAKDADAAATVARSFVDRGDGEGRGSRRAHRLAAAWRDRENDAIAVLTAALLHDHTPWDLSHLLFAIACWLPGATRPDPALADRLLPYALSDDASTAQCAQLSLGRLGDQRVLTAIATPHADALIALAAHTRRPEHQRLVLRKLAGLGFDAFLATLTPDEAHTLLPELKNLLRRDPTPALVRRFADWDIHDAELPALLEEAARSTDDELVTAAVVTAARLGTDPAPALRVLERQLTADSPARYGLAEATRLGPAAAPLLPMIEPYHQAGYAWSRLHAAQADLAITQDPTRAVPTLVDLATRELQYPAGVEAVRTLARLGSTPDALRPQVEHWATSLRRVIDLDEFFNPVMEPRCADDLLREAALLML